MRFMGWLAVLMLLWSPAVWAQEEDDSLEEKESAIVPEAEPVDEADRKQLPEVEEEELTLDDMLPDVDGGESQKGDSQEAASGDDDEDLPQIGEQDRLAVFELDRGFYFASDLGVFMSFGGVNGVSNVQPYVAIKIGHDVGEYFSIQASISKGFVANNPISANDRPGAGGENVTNYSMTSFGGEAVLSFRPSPRLALEPKVGGGITYAYPKPTDPNNIGAVLSATNPHLAFGLDLKYLTLMTDFTAGISTTGYYVLGLETLALGTGLNVRYTF